MKVSYPRPPIVGFAAALVLFFAVAHPAMGHTEGKMQLAAAPAGPFQITAWTSPDPAREGDLHVAAIVFSAEDASPILDAAVEVTVTPTDDAAAERSQAAVLGAGENQLLYESVFTAIRRGEYHVTVRVTGADGGQGEASFGMEVVANGGFNWLFALLGLAILAIVVLALARRRRPPAPALGE